MRIKRVALALSALAAIPAAAFAQPARPLEVIELYQSQGCSSCPPANAFANSLAGDPDKLVLSFAVTYWDQLGWKDIFASPAYTARQWDYAHARSESDVATPEILVNGRHGVRGSDRRALNDAVAAGARDAAGPEITVSGGTVTVAAGHALRPADVWLVRYDPRTISVAVRAGENDGRTLPHRNIVKQLVRLGDWDGHAQRFALPPSPAPGLNVAVLVQAGKGGPVLSAARG